MPLYVYVARVYINLYGQFYSSNMHTHSQAEMGSCKVLIQRSSCISRVE